MASKYGRNHFIAGESREAGIRRTERLAERYEMNSDPKFQQMAATLRRNAQAEREQLAQIRLRAAAAEAEAANLSVDSLADEPAIEEIAARWGVSSGDMCHLMEQRMINAQSVAVMA